MSARLTMDETFEHVGRTGGNQLQTLDDRLRETAERLHEVEIDNEAMRSRLTLRQQELDEARHAVGTMHTNEDDAELRARLKAAEERAHALALRVDELEAELDRATTRVRLTELAEGLRGLDDELEIVQDGYLLDRPVVLRDVPTVALPSEFK